MLRHKAISPSFASLNSKRYIARAVAWRTPNLACLLETGDVVECPCEPWAAEAVQNWTTFTSLDDIALKSVADGFLAQLVTLNAPLLSRRGARATILRLMRSYFSGCTLKTAQFLHARVVLEELAKHGLLVSEAGLLQRCRNSTASEERCAIGIVGILSGDIDSRSRVPTIQAGRAVPPGFDEVELCFVGGDEPANVGSFLKGGHRTYLDRSARLRMTDGLARAGVPRDVAAFAILGSRRFGQSGSRKNALLLYAAGTTVMLTRSVDDSFVLTCPNPQAVLALDNAPGKPLLLPANYVPRPAEDARPSLLDISNAMIGRTPSAILEDFAATSTVEFRSICPHIVESILRCDGKVIQVSGGAECDISSDTVSGVLGAVRCMAPLLDEKATEIFANGVRLFDTTDANVLCHEYTLGSDTVVLDARDMLPPFLPTNGDPEGEVFSHLLNTCFPEGYSGRAPFVGLHPRTAIGIPQAEWSGPRLSEVIVACIASMCRDYLRFDPRIRMREIGTFLRELGKLPPDAFAREANRRLWEKEYRQLGEIERRIDTWRAHSLKAGIKAWIAMRREASIRADYWVPRELGSGRLCSWAVCQQVIVQFGNLLWWWPEMVNIIKDSRVAESIWR